MSAVVLLLALLMPPPRHVLRPAPESVLCVPAELLRFPPREIAEEALRFNAACRPHVRFRHACTGRHLACDATLEWEEFDRCWACWNALHNATDTGCDQAACLGRLRELLGEADWRRGHMPPAAPSWSFRRFEGPP